MNIEKTQVFFLLLIGLLLTNCKHSDEPLPTQDYEVDSLLVIHESESYKHNSTFIKGHFINRTKEIEVSYMVKNNLEYKITFTPPVVVAVASKNENWGYFQFPKIAWGNNRVIDVSWQMKPDNVESYGDDFGMISAHSIDQGKTWSVKNGTAVTKYLTLPNGDKLSIYTPRPFSISNYPIQPIQGTNKYLLKNLPDSLKNIYFKRQQNGSTEWVIEMSKLVDPSSLRYSEHDFTLMPIVWWGDMQIESSDQSVVAGIYPGHYLDSDGITIPPSGISFYKSNDNGHSWSYLSRIRNIPISTEVGGIAKRYSYSEPAFAILPNGNYLCVVRTTVSDISVLIGFLSKDKGHTWSSPFIVSPNGVDPRLLQLKNGVTVLSAGRPGLQIRFSTDLDGKKWSDPFEMLPVSLSENKHATSCGYSGMIPISDNSFMVVYSDFKYPVSGIQRKAIIVRRITIEKAS